jgi:hypothetical protein
MCAQCAEGIHNYTAAKTATLRYRLSRRVKSPVKSGRIIAPFKRPTSPTTPRTSHKHKPSPNLAMSGANAPEILAAYDAVRSDKDSTNWLIISYASSVGDKLTLSSTGSGGLEELSTKLDDSQAQYAYVRVEYANDTESKRVKFVLVIWIGEGTKVMRKVCCAPISW